MTNPKTPPRQDKTCKILLSNPFVANQNLKGRTLKPEAAYSSHQKNRKKFSKPEGSIAEGYVAEEALTLSSHYFRDVTTKFNRLERNVDPPPPTCQFQAFRSVCNTIGLRSFPPFGAKEFNKARWYVLHNSPEIDTYRAQFQRGVIVVENEPDIIHLDNSSDLPPSTSGNDLDNMDDVCTHMGGGGKTVCGEDLHVQLLTYIIRICRGASSTEEKESESPILWRREKPAGRPGKGTRKPVLKMPANKGRPIEIGFEDRVDNTVKVPAGDKARLMATLGTTYNLEPHMRSERWPRIDGYIQAQFGKTYNTNKATLKREHWIKDPETGAYDLDRIRRGKPDEYTDDEWEKYINFWNDPANAQRAETNRLNRSKSTVVSRHGSRSIPLTRHLMKMTSATQEEPPRGTSKIDTFYRLHTVNGYKDGREAPRRRHEQQHSRINGDVRGEKLRGHFLCLGSVLPGYVRLRAELFPHNLRQKQYVDLQDDLDDKPT
ncbi:F-box domain containing protein [Tanacetum coccineum]|uniref:F-box domain containing protein n=1 Tax=Tanacetum coccineum TaxID=301880 RepID=A0ABQ5FLK3_9ASTR